MVPRNRSEGGRLYCGIVVLAPDAMENFVGQSFIDFVQDGEGDHPVLMVLVGATAEEDAIAVLNDRIPLEFPAELVRDIRLHDITAVESQVHEGGWLAADFGIGMVRVPAVYFLVDGAERTTAEALRYVRELVTETNENGTGKEDDTNMNS